MNPIDTLFEVATPIQRKLLENVRYVPETECWEWTGIFKGGALIYDVRTKTNGRAASIAYEEFIGPLVEGDFIKNSCGLKKCINPAHGTPTYQLPKGYWTKERCAEEALKYTSRAEFRDMSKSASSIASRNGWMNEICRHMIGRYAPKGYWTKERCAEEALKYTSRAEFRKAASAAGEASYQLADRKGWLDEICQHMHRLAAPRGYWTKERCAEEALKYTSRAEFRKLNSACWHAVYKNGWLDEICEHMQRRLTPIAA